MKFNKKSITFFWEGIDARGFRVHGQQQAFNKNDLIQQLEKQHIILLKIKRQYLSNLKLQSNKVTTKMIAVFTQQLATLQSAGVQLSKALDIIIKNDKQSCFTNMITTVKQEIESGMSLSQALKEFPQFFDPVYCNIICAGEQSGQLGDVLLCLADHLHDIIRLKNKFTKALFYPITILIISLLITMGLVVFVVPQFASIFKDFGAQLPLMTRSIIAISKFIKKYWFLFFLIICAITISIRVLRYSSWFVPIYQTILCKTPVLGTLIRLANTARWFQTLSTTITAGINLIDAITAATNTMNISSYKQTLQLLLNKIISGLPLHKAMYDTKLFTNSEIQMVAIGENGGSLPIILQKIADTQKNDLNNQLDNLSKMIEPVIMIILSIVIGSLIIAMYIPIFQIGTVL